MTLELYYALLSGLHPTLPRSELKAILEAEESKHTIIEELDQLTLYHCRGPACGSEALRAGLIHETGAVLAVAEAEEKELLDKADTIDPCEAFRPGDRVRIEFTRVKGYAKKQVPDDIGRKLAARLEREAAKCRVALTPRNPTRTLRVIVTQATAVIGVRKALQPKKLLDQHRPTKRPFFHPGSLDPRLARLFVNLARARPPGPYLDPFCGTGGFPLEAQTLGIPAICGELAGKLVEGAKTNLNAYPGHENTITVIQWDATRLPLRDNSVQSIGTDPPYGRSVSTRGKPAQQLYTNFLEEAARVLKKNTYLAMAAPHWLEETIEEKAEQTGLKIREKHYMRVHGSLTRVVYLLHYPA